MDRMIDEAASYEKLAALVEERAERVRRHAAVAQQEAERLADPELKKMHLWEAKTHKNTAALIMRTAGLYRRRAQDLRAMRSAGSPRRLTAITGLLAEERSQVARERQRLAAQADELPVTPRRAAAVR
jgi:hypothetical protein